MEKCVYCDKSLNEEEFRFAYESDEIFCETCLKKLEESYPAERDIEDYYFNKEVDRQVDLER
jgi:recombinational DNA repair protein (RecF pathway)